MTNQIVRSRNLWLRRISALQLWSVLSRRYGDFICRHQRHEEMDLLADIHVVLLCIAWSPIRLLLKKYLHMYVE